MSPTYTSPLRFSEERRRLSASSSEYSLPSTLQLPNVYDPGPTPFDAFIRHSNPSSPAGSTQVFKAERLAVPRSDERDPPSDQRGRRRRSRTLSHRSMVPPSTVTARDQRTSSSTRHVRQRSPSLSKILRQDAEASQRLLNVFDSAPRSSRQRVQSSSTAHNLRQPFKEIGNASHLEAHSHKGAPELLAVSADRAVGRSPSKQSRARMRIESSNRDTSSDDCHQPRSRRCDRTAARRRSRTHSHTTTVSPVRAPSPLLGAPVAGYGLNQPPILQPTTPTSACSPSIDTTLDISQLDASLSDVPPKRPPRSVRRRSTMHLLIQGDLTLPSNPSSPCLPAPATGVANAAEATSPVSMFDAAAPSRSPPATTEQQESRADPPTLPLITPSTTQSTMLSLDPRSEDGLAADVGTNVQWEMLTAPSDSGGSAPNSAMQGIESWRLGTIPFVTDEPTDECQVFVADINDELDSKTEISERGGDDEVDHTYSSSFWDVPVEAFLATTALEAVHSSHSNSTLPSAASTARPGRGSPTAEKAQKLSLAPQSSCTPTVTPDEPPQRPSGWHQSPDELGLPGSFMQHSPEGVDDPVGRTSPPPSSSSPDSLGLPVAEGVRVADSHESPRQAIWTTQLLTRTRSESSSTEFQSADEGSEHDWTLQGGSRQSVSWFEAAEAFERQHGCARGSASWRTSIRFSAQHRISIAPGETREIQKRLSVFEEHRLSKHAPAWEAELEDLADKLGNVPPLLTPSPADIPSPASEKLEAFGVQRADRAPPVFQSKRSAIFNRSASYEREALSIADESRAASSTDIDDAMDNRKTVAFKDASVPKLSGQVSRKPSQKTQPGSEKRKSLQARHRLTEFMMSVPLMLIEAPSANLWRASLTKDQHAALLARFGPKEIHRQEVIWELCETEASFVQSICSIQRLFALPQRSSDGRWVDGVPCIAARLFDWLEDILSFHQRLSAILQQIRTVQSPVVLTFADTISRLVQRLEVHQPYLVRFESVTKQLETMVREEGSEFGAFVRLQLQLPECGNMPLSSFLLKPVQRLMKYPLFFRQLHELTPEGHPDHAATRQLHVQTESLIRDMNNVKAREEEYAELKDLQERLHGLPPDIFIATRERKLIHQGTICCVDLGSEAIVQPLDDALSACGHTTTIYGVQKLLPAPTDLSDLRPSALSSRPVQVGIEAPSVLESSFHASSTSSTSASSRTQRGHDVSSASMSSTQASSIGGLDVSIRSSQPGSRVPDGDIVSARPRSLRLPSSLTMEDISRAERMSVSMPSTPTSAVHHDFETTFAHRPMVERKTSAIASLLLRSAKSDKKEKEKASNRANGPTLLHVFVFTDMVVLTTVDEDVTIKDASKSSRIASWGRKKSANLSPRMDRRDSAHYNVLDRIGISRVISTTTRPSDHGYRLELSILPIKPDGARRSNPAGPTTLSFSFVNGSDGHPATSEAAEQALTRWNRAFERSLLHSIRISREQAALLSPAAHGDRDPMRPTPPPSSRSPTPLSAHNDWARRAQQVTDLVTAAARAGDRPHLVALLQSGLPFPKSPSQQDLVLHASEQLAAAQQQISRSNASPNLTPGAEDPASPVRAWTMVGMNVLDEVEEEREERRWWSLRLAEVKGEMAADKVVDDMAARKRVEERDKFFESEQSLATAVIGAGERSMAWSVGNLARSTIAARRKGRGGLPILGPNTSMPPSRPAARHPTLSLKSRNAWPAVSSPCQPSFDLQPDQLSANHPSPRPARRSNSVQRPYASSPTASQFSPRDIETLPTRSVLRSPRPVRSETRVPGTSSSQNVQRARQDVPPALPPIPPPRTTPYVQARPPTPPHRSSRRATKSGAASPHFPRSDSGHT